MKHLFIVAVTFIALSNVFRVTDRPVAKLPYIEIPESTELSAPAEVRHVIVAYTEEWCLPCKRWKADCLEALKVAGWEVEIRSGGGGSVPRFSVETNGKTGSWVGYSSREDFYARLQKVIDQKR